MHGLYFLVKKGGRIMKRLVIISVIIGVILSLGIFKVVYADRPSLGSSRSSIPLGKQGEYTSYLLDLYNKTANSSIKSLIVSILKKWGFTIDDDGKLVQLESNKDVKVSGLGGSEWNLLKTYADNEGNDVKEYVSRTEDQEADDDSEAGKVTYKHVKLTYDSKGRVKKREEEGYEEGGDEHKEFTTTIYYKYDTQILDRVAKQEIESWSSDAPDQKVYQTIENNDWNSLGQVTNRRIDLVIEGSEGTKTAYKIESGIKYNGNGEVSDKDVEQGGDFKF
jgi:hypothetical protein